MKSIVFFLFILLVSLSVIWITLPCNTVFAATKAEILAQAKEALKADKSLDQIATQALEAALESGIAFEEIAPPLAESIMLTGIGMGQNGFILAADICSSLDRVLILIEVDSAVRLRALSQAVLGIRAAAARTNLDEIQVCNQIENTLVAMAPTKDAAQQIMQVIASAYEQAFAETYMPPVEPTAPAPPPAAPPTIIDTYDATASPS